MAPYGGYESLRLSLPSLPPGFFSSSFFLLPLVFRSCRMGTAPCMLAMRMEKKWRGEEERRERRDEREVIEERGEGGEEKEEGKERDGEEREKSRE